MTERLWAPWRVPYVKKVTSKSAKSELFERIFSADDDRNNLIFCRREFAFSVLNLYPYNNGHSLVVPNRKVADLSDLYREERDGLMDLLDETKVLLTRVMNPDGFNIGINLGSAAGAGIPEHLHVHIVPRWDGDVNFMPVTGNTKVISQSLESLYELLIDAQKN